jgi:hypothetical protein
MMTVCPCGCLASHLINRAVFYPAASWRRYAPQTDLSILALHAGCKHPSALQAAHRIIERRATTTASRNKHRTQELLSEPLSFLERLLLCLLFLCFFSLRRRLRRALLLSLSLLSLLRSLRLCFLCFFAFLAAFRLRSSDSLSDSSESDSSLEAHARQQPVPKRCACRHAARMRARTPTPRLWRRPRRHRRRPARQQQARLAHPCATDAARGCLRTGSCSALARTTAPNRAHLPGALKPFRRPAPFQRPRSSSTSTPPVRRAAASSPLLFSYTFSPGGGGAAAPGAPATGA